MINLVRNEIFAGKLQFIDGVSSTRCGSRWFV